MEFSLHGYIKQLRTEGAPPNYIDAIQRNARPLADEGLPVILTMGQLSFSTGVSYDVLQGIIERKIDPYRVFAIRKRGGGKRYICVPEPGVLALQRWIHNNILLSDAAQKKLLNQCTAYRPKSSHVENARRHLGAEWLLKLDIKQFFESVSERQVYYVFREIGYRALVAFGLARLCTRVLPGNIDYRARLQPYRWSTGKRRGQISSSVVGHLPQGAPSSPMLANLVCVTLDKKLNELASREQLHYTRYADDMVFSGSFADRRAAEIFAREVSRIVAQFGFAVNHQKTTISKDGGRKIVTGISVEGEVIRLPRVYKEKIRQELYYIQKFGAAEHCRRKKFDNPVSYLMSLYGRIVYLCKIEPQIGRKFLDLFHSGCPEFDAVAGFLRSD